MQDGSRVSPQCDLRDIEDTQASDTQMAGMLFSVAIDNGCKREITHLRM